MVQKPQEAPAESSHSHLPSVIRKVLESKSAKTLTALAGLLAAEANTPNIAEADEPNMVTKVLVDDTFSGELNENVWRVDDDYANDSAAFTSEGELALFNGASISTRECAEPTPDAPVVITGEWTPVLDQQSNTHALTVRLRTNGNGDQHPQNCVMLVAYTNLDVFLTKKTNDFYGKIAENKSRALKIGETYTFRIIDDGNGVTAEFFDSDNNRVIALGANAPFEESNNGNQTIFMARDNGISALDNIRITTLEEEEVVEEPEPEPETTVLEIINDEPESSATPTADMLTEEQYLELLQELEEKEATISNWQEQAEKLTPTFELIKNQNATSATLKFTNAAVGSKVVVVQGYGNSEIVLEKSLTESTGSLTLKTPYVNDRGGHYVYIIDPDGTASYIGIWDTMFGKNFGNITKSTMSYEESEKLEYDNPTYASSQEEYESLNDEIATIQLQINSYQAQLNTPTEAAAIEQDTTTAEAVETYLYSRLHVTQGADAEHIIIQYMTPADNTQIVVQSDRDAHGNHRSKTLNTSHEGGIIDGYINFNLHSVQTGIGSKLTVSMLVDGVLTDQVVLYTKNNNIAGGSKWEFGELEEGRTVENPLGSALEIVATNGPQLTIAGQTSYDGVNVVMEGGGYLSRHNADTDGGSALFMQNFAFNASNPSGNYKIKMYDTRNGMLLNEIEFYWDANTKTITPAENEQHVAALQAPEMQDYVREVQEQVNSQAELGEIDIGFVSLRTVQRTFFSERSAHFLHDTRFDEILANFPIQGHPDSGSILNEGMAVYNETLGDLLQEAAKVAIAAWNGEDQEAAAEAFHRRYEELSSLRKLNEFKIDFNMTFPTADEILQDGMNIVQEHIGDLQVIQAKEISMRKRSAYLASREGPETERQISEAARLHNLMIVENAHGEDSAQYEAYVTAWGDGTSVQVADGEQNIDAAIEEYKLYLETEYADDPEGYNNALKEYLESLDHYVVSYEEEKAAEKDYVRAAVVRAMTAGDNPIMVASADIDSIYDYLKNFGEEIRLLTEGEIRETVNEQIINYTLTGSLTGRHEDCTVEDIRSLYSLEQFETGVELSSEEKFESFIAANIASFAYDDNATKLDNSIFGLYDEWRVVDGVLDIEDGYLRVGNAGIVFVELEVGDDKILFVGFEGTNLPSKDNSPFENINGIQDILDDIRHIDKHIDMSIVSQKVESLFEQRNYSKIIATGHSLGGAMAQLFMKSKLASSDGVEFAAYTYGSPGLLHAQPNDSRIVNFLHMNDLVPYMGASRKWVIPFLPDTIGKFFPDGSYHRSGRDILAWPEVNMDLKNLLAPHDREAYVNSMYDIN